MTFQEYLSDKYKTESTFSRAENVSESFSLSSRNGSINHNLLREDIESFFGELIGEKGMYRVPTEKGVNLITLTSTTDQVKCTVQEYEFKQNP